MYVDQNRIRDMHLTNPNGSKVEYYYAGMPLYLKMQARHRWPTLPLPLQKDENGDFVVTGSQTIGTVAANTIADQKITKHLNNQSQFVKFT